MRTALLLLLALASSAPAATRWQVDPAQSELNFSGAAQGEAFSGRFARFAVELQFDPADLAGSHLRVDIDLASADSANAERDELLQSAEFFASAEQPQAQFRSSAIEALGDQRFRANGELMLKGQSRPVALEFRWQAKADGAELIGTATLQRLDFAIGSGDWADLDMIANAVEVTTRLSLRGQ